MGKNESYEDEEMTVELELEDGTVVNCAVITILTVEAKDYIVLLPLDEDGENEDGEVWFYVQQTRGFFHRFARHVVIYKYPCFSFQ